MYNNNNGMVFVQFILPSVSLLASQVLIVALYGKHEKPCWQGTIT